jgi:hypothetical protein
MKCQSPTRTRGCIAHRLADRSRAPGPLPGGRRRVVFHPKLQIPEGANEQEITQLCWQQFEPVVMQNPSPWLWMYKYWRYRPTKATRPYPYYSHPVPKFDQLLASSAALTNTANG